MALITIEDEVMLGVKANDLPSGECVNCDSSGIAGNFCVNCADEGFVYEPVDVEETTDELVYKIIDDSEDGLEDDSHEGEDDEREMFNFLSAVAGRLGKGNVEEAMPLFLS